MGAEETWGGPLERVRRVTSSGGMFYRRSGLLGWYLCGRPAPVSHPETRDRGGARPDQKAAPAPFPRKGSREDPLVARQRYHGPVGSAQCTDRFRQRLRTPPLYPPSDTPIALWVAAAPTVPRRPGTSAYAVDWVSGQHLDAGAGIHSFPPEPGPPPLVPTAALSLTRSSHPFPPPSSPLSFSSLIRSPRLALKASCLSVYHPRPETKRHSPHPLP